MSKKKIREEELIKTHVININEIREAESREENDTHKKISKKCFFFGFLLIILGICFPFANKYFVSNDTVVAYTSKVKNTLSCVSNIDNNQLNVKVYTVSNYTFDSNNKLSKSNTKIRVTSPSNDINTINYIIDYYKTIYVDSPSTFYNFYVSGNSLLINQTINNYNLFDYTTYNNEINNFSQTKVFTKDYNMSMIKSDLEKIGNLCN